MKAAETVSEEYEIRVAGRLSEALLSVFEGMTASERPAQTVLRGQVQDQADLHRLIDRAHELGLELLAVRRIRPDPKIEADDLAIESAAGSPIRKRRGRGKA